MDIDQGIIEYPRRARRKGFAALLITGITVSSHMLPAWRRPLKRFCGADNLFVNQGTILNTPEYFIRSAHMPGA